MTVRLYYRHPAGRNIGIKQVRFQKKNAFFSHPLLIRNRIKRRNGIPLRFTLGASQSYAEHTPYGDFAKLRRGHREIKQIIL
jgi:hypothetical protein